MSDAQKFWDQVSDSEYDPKVDFGRLQMSAAVHQEQDLQNIETIVSVLKQWGKAPPYQVLDMGCGYGITTADRFGNDSRFEVVAVDDCEEVLETARRWFSEENITYKLGDAESSISRFKEEFDIVVATYLFHHITYQEQTLQNLWEYVADGGALFVRSCDDGQHMHYPPDERMEYVVEKADEIEGSSDRTHGRRLPTQFKRVLTPAPSVIDFNAQNYSTAGKPAKEREQYWEVFHSNRRYYAERIFEADDALPEEIEDAKQMVEYMDQLREKFRSNEEFVDMKTVPVGIAYKDVE